MRIHRLASILSVALEVVVGLLLLTVLSLSIGEVVSRWVTRQSLVFINELNRFLFTWLTFLAIPAALNRGIHFRSTLLSRALPRTSRARLETGVDAVVVAFALVLIIQGIEMVNRTAVQRSNVLDIQMSYMYASLPICGVLMILFLAFRWARALSEGHLPDPAMPDHGDDSATSADPLPIQAAGKGEA